MCSYRLHCGLFSHWQILVLSCGNNVPALIPPELCRALEGRGGRSCAACLLLVACRTGIIVRMETGSLPSRWDAYARRLPSSLEDLRGPAAGEIELPLHVAWSGRRMWDVGREDQRLVLYALLLAEAQREDLERFVHRESLVSMWPRLRLLLGPHARREWERQLITPASR
jgi:hypothetical protein